MPRLRVFRLLRKYVIMIIYVAHMRVLLLLQRHFLLFDFHLDLHIKLLLLLSGLCGQVVALMFHLGLQDGHPLFQLFIQHFVVAVFLLGDSSLTQQNNKSL